MIITISYCISQEPKKDNAETKNYFLVVVYTSYIYIYSTTTHTQAIHIQYSMHAHNIYNYYIIEIVCITEIHHILCDYFYLNLS